MPVDYRIDEQFRVVFCRAYGQVTAEELLQVSSAMLEAPAYAPDLDYLADAREVDASALTSDGLRELVDFNLSVADRVEPTRMAYVVSGDLAFGLGRMLATLSEESKIEHRVFRDMAEARGWLGLPPEAGGRP